MNRVITAALVAMLIIGADAMAHEPHELTASEMDSKAYFTGQVHMGYFSGAGVHFSGTVANFAEGFPFRIRFGVGHAWIPAGDELLARRVFVDANTNGDPRSSATVWDARMDILYPMKLFSLERSMVFGGIRRSSYEGNFEYIGGNETFIAYAKQWGVGGGVETAFALSPRVDMILLVGADYFFRGEMNGHDSYYNPDGDDLNPIANYTYKDADAAINQPDVETRMMMGLAYRF